MKISQIGAMFLLLALWPSAAFAEGLFDFDSRLTPLVGLGEAGDDLRLGVKQPGSDAPPPRHKQAQQKHGRGEADAAAEDGGSWRMTWRWARFRTWQYIVTLTLAPGTFVFARWLPQPKAFWTSTNGFDDAARDAVRATSVDGRYNANLLSDIFWYSLMAYPVLIDSALVAWGIRGSPDVAWQMFMIIGQSFAVTGTLGNLLAFLGRERPFTQDCGEPDAKCGSGGANRSFYSGHTAVSFTAACLLCFFHLKMELYGGGLADALTCATGMGMAGTVGLLRMTADKHYLTDVLFGVGVGIVSGFVLPWYLHYRYERSSDKDKRSFRTIGPLMTDSGGIGLSYIGAF